jgi:hypothetical protein
MAAAAVTDWLLTASIAIVRPTPNVQVLFDARQTIIVTQ